MSTSSWSVLAQTTFARLSHEFIKMRPLLPTYLHLIVSAAFPIYTAAHASLRRPASAAPAKKDKTKKSETDDDEKEESSSPVEALTTSDAIMFPVLAGATLTALYLIIKWLEDPAILNKILGYYFSWLGTFFTFKFLKDVFRLLRSLVFPAQVSKKGGLYSANAESNQFKLTLPTASSTTPKGRFDFAREWIVQSLVLPASNFKAYWTIRRSLHKRVKCTVTARKPFTPGKSAFNIDVLDMVAASSSALIAALTLSLKRTPWYLTNLSGFSFCYGSLQFMSPGSSATGSLLLSLLFIYDIYMVFYTPMMVTVATKLDVPIKLLFPRPADTICPKPLDALAGSEEMEEYLRCLAKQKTMAMLGLGDIVVPGILIAFALRFDLYNYYLKMKKESVKTEKGEDHKATYRPARGSWAERLYTARNLWSSGLEAKSFPKPYFKATMIGYVAGLLATLGVMQVYQHAQPALLYLVPGVLTSFWGTALWRGEVKVLWNFDESQEEKEREKKEKEKEKAKQDEKSKSDASEIGDKADKPAANEPSDTNIGATSDDSTKTSPALSLDFYISS